MAQFVTGGTFFQESTSELPKIYLFVFWFEIEKRDFFPLNKPQKCFLADGVDIFAGLHDWSFFFFSSSLSNMALLYIPFWTKLEVRCHANSSDEPSVRLRLPWVTTSQALL